MVKTLPRALFGLLIAFGLLAIVSSETLAASLSFSPSSKSLSLNDTLTLSVILNTAGSSTDEVDAVITFDKNKLQYVSATLGNLLDNPQTVTAPTSNKLTLSASSTEGESYSGTGTFATLKFKAISTGTATISFDFTSGVATDSNVASNGADILTSTSNGTYTIGAASSSGELPETGTSAPTVIAISVGLILISSPLLIKKIL